MRKYKYQMHTHTIPCSKCSEMTHQELIESLVRGGYKGCVLTNHFFKGNTGIDRNLTWNDFIAQYEEDYIQCKKMASKENINIIFGIEEHLFDGLEILCYGITPQFLYDNPQLRDDHTIETWSKTIRKFGAVCVQAHPFRDRAYIINPRLLPAEYIDGIEIFNACNKPDENKQAASLVPEHPDWIFVSGADAHSPSFVCNSGIETNTEITDEKTLANVLKSRDYELII